MPLIFVELSYSQYSNLGPGRVWICCPLFKGIGYGMVVMTGIVSLYYNVILAWTLYYFGMSFFPTIPWSNCANEWNTDACYMRGINNTSNMNFTRKTTTEEFWERHVLEITPGIEHPGYIRWQLLLCLLAAWFAVFLCLIKGIKTSGKVVYVAATVPYLFLIVLLVRGLTLPGAVDGLLFYTIPRWKDLLKFSVWGDAAVQMFYSAGLGWGGIATLASYNKFNNNCYRDAMILPFIDCITSWFAGCVIFVTLGFMANQANVSIGEVVEQEALSRLPIPQLWSVLFFLMLFTVGLDSQMVHVQTLTGALTDNFPHLFSKRKTILTAVICILGFLLGLPCITQGGVYVLQLMDWYCASISVMFLAFLEVTVMAWCYGSNRLLKDLEMMLGYKPSVAQLTPVKYGKTTYPPWAVGIGLVIAAFMIPYFVFVFICALPLIFVELSYSQYSNLGPGRVWICCPLFKGIGYGMVVMTCIVGLYYNVILAWTLYYFGMSFFPTIPWSNCANEWNTDACYMRGINTANVTMSLSNVSSPEENSVYNISEAVARNFTQKTTTEEFWERHVLEITSGIEDPGYIRWQLLLCLFAAWLAVFLCLFKGIKTSGKVVYVAATVPYLFLIVLLVRGLTLPGALDGFLFYTIPRWKDLLKFSVWGDAAVQVFYSAGLGFGGLATLASYNKFNNNCYRDAMILPFIDCFTSWFAGCVIFVTLGFMANQARVSIGEVVEQGPGIAFMVYPEALSRLPLPQLWSALFFLMLFTVGLDSQMVHVQILTGAITDNFPHLFYKRKTILTAVICILGFIFGFPCITQGGVYVLQLMDWYCASISVMFIAFLEITVMAWCYGSNRLLKDIEMMLGYKPTSLWTFFWKFITPVSTMFIWIFSVAQLTPVKYGKTTYPPWAVGIGLVIGILSLIPIPVGMVGTLLGTKGSITHVSRSKGTKIKQKNSRN
ncbi:hypothetical protein KUTeg_002469 [Tegillarca granosa]|uniref:Uncharacterized protein n=1 Tax=Tegillarca granosa TaxID=220873 RepID=A0ABQ9FVQ8_TEGGR|nr:hypothetical protein KUTeg_002469 [Tegillarca granosa]